MNIPGHGKHTEEIWFRNVEEKVAKLVKMTFTSVLLNLIFYALSFCA
jgi:hypothetical protein